MVLPDLLQSDLKVVFCGTAAGDKSADRKSYYAGIGNSFYPTLVLCRFTPHLLQPSQFPELIHFGIGLTDLAKFTHGMDFGLKDEDYDTKSFQEKILKFQPGFVCFNGKEAARVYLELKTTKDVPYGLQQSTINKTKLYVAPSTSFTARKHWNPDFWQQLKHLVG